MSVSLEVVQHMNEVIRDVLFSTLVVALYLLYVCS